MLTPPSALGLGAAWQGRGRALCALSYLGILIREVQAWGRFGWREPGAALGPSRAGTALSVLTLPMGTDLLPFECPWEVPRHTTSPVPHLHALAALPTDSEHPFLCQVRWEQGPDTPNSAGCAGGGLVSVEGPGCSCKLELLPGSRAALIYSMQSWNSGREAQCE